VASIRSSGVNVSILGSKRTILAVLDDFKEIPLVGRGVVGGKGPVVIISEIGCVDGRVEVKENGSFFYCLFCLTFALAPFARRRGRSRRGFWKSIEGGWRGCTRKPRMGGCCLLIQGDLSLPFGSLRLESGRLEEPESIQDGPSRRAWPFKRAITAGGHRQISRTAPTRCPRRPIYQTHPGSRGTNP
jgi:hypothetical protein